MAGGEGHHQHAAPRLQGLGWGVGNQPPITCCHAVIIPQSSSSKPPSRALNIDYSACRYVFTEVSGLTIPMALVAMSAEDWQRGLDFSSQVLMVVKMAMSNVVVGELGRWSDRGGPGAGGDGGCGGALQEVERGLRFRRMVHRPG